MDFKYVYKICTKEEWKIAKKIGKFEGSIKEKKMVSFTFLIRIN